MGAAGQTRMIGYLCGTDWHHDLTLQGQGKLYSSVELLKRKEPCWIECGIVAVEIKKIEWVP